MKLKIKTIKTNSTVVQPPPTCFAQVALGSAVVSQAWVPAARVPPQSQVSEERRMCQFYNLSLHRV